MKAIRVHDQTRGALDFDLKDILATLGAQAAKSSWIVTAVEGEDDFGLDATGPASTELSALAEAGTRVDGRHLIRLAEEIRQTIWGKFVGYDGSSADLKKKIAAKKAKLERISK